MIIGDLRSLVRRATWAVIPVASVTVLSIAAYLGILQLSGNFHAVIPGAIYRSAQPTASDIAHYNMTYGIKTIVNLRGEKRRAGWYQAELAEARSLGITHVDFKMSAWRELSPTQAAELIDIFQRAEKPILIHCDAGADRSGLASALYLAAVAKSGEAAAEAQLSIRYGHVSFPLFAAYSMDRTFESLEPWLGFQGS